MLNSIRISHGYYSFGRSVGAEKKLLLGTAIGKSIFSGKFKRTNYVVMSEILLVLQQDQDGKHYTAGPYLGEEAEGL